MKRSRGTEIEYCYMLPSGVTKWPRPREASQMCEKGTTMGGIVGGWNAPAGSSQENGNSNGYLPAAAPTTTTGMESFGDLKSANEHQG